ncbi:MAG: hypothetical protein ACAI35_21515 [Candidatus Methylacidiphilales bacterium]
MSYFSMYLCIGFGLVMHILWIFPDVREACRTGSREAIHLSIARIAVAFFCGIILYSISIFSPWNIDKLYAENKSKGNALNPNIQSLQQLNEPEEK